MEIEEISVESMIATSGVHSDEYGIDYGGVDEDGKLTPSSRSRRGTWGRPVELIVSDKNVGVRNSVLLHFCIEFYIPVCRNSSKSSRC